MKKKYITILPCLILLLLSAVYSSFNMKSNYDEIVNASGLNSNNFEIKVKEENDKAAKDEDEYQKMLTQEQGNEQENPGQGTDTASQVKDDLKLHARSALLLDAANDRVLYEENGYKKMPMASTTKIMTCIVALENADLNGIVTVSSYAAGMPDVQLNIKKGEQFYLKDLLYSLMLESHNDVAVAIAEYVGGSVEGFATLMNDKARTLGCYDTNFITPNGLDAEGHYTTARDLAVIASYAIKNKQFIDITNTPNYSFSEITKGRKYSVRNHNRFLYLMEGAIGVKTGFTGDAGYCFVGAIRRTDRTLVSVVLGCGWPPRKNLKWSDTAELMNYGVKNYREKQIFQKAEFDPLIVEDGQKKYETLDIKGDLPLLMREDEVVRIEYLIPDKLKAPVKANQIIGKAQYYINGVLYRELPIYATQDILKIDFPFCFKEILKLWTNQY